ncbi:YbjQ family protein [Moraxella sp. FZLJ2107]|uniref:YbjQ family protein n=1 Tax=unclassified Moraxella TaxID=2685852 RepID=UPI00209C3A4D|nr:MULTISPECIES: heavy metal-binding domain-containing protein [unclassified Moraxella]USZ15838.1 YbjQ family protein [Moraxella sp. FZFQ2102]UTO06165.1 YbjQ family protein [Moraxella sp. FZLJ2107]UTO23442.1 YbjQ family protein [Moraxella sp. FZLJ2109]
MDIEAVLFRYADWIFAIVLFVVGWYFGTRAEKKHLASLQKDESDLAHITVSSERFFEPVGVRDSVFVTGSVVIAQDRFKLVMAAIMSLFGKNLTVYESLLDRARREAVVRAKHQANHAGCHAIYGIRFEMCDIDGGVEVLAYGVAVK